MFENFEKYGLTFERLNPSNLELLRVWRNSDFVRSRMLYQTEITPEMQQNWFSKLDQSANYYYLVKQNEEYVGVASIKDIKDGQGEPGFFLVSEQYKNTTVTSLTYLAMADFYFEELGISKLYIHVRRDNEEAMKSNLFLGYKTMEEKSTSEFLYMELNKETFLANSQINKLRKFIIKK
jgi:RimJ/RimL family protein N-acetyltransferase